MQFVELLPKYTCTDSTHLTPYVCAPFKIEGKNGNPDTPAFCEDNGDRKPGIIATVNYDDDLSLHNWIEDLKPDLTCSHGFTSPIGILGSM